MIPDEIHKMKSILDSFLGDSKGELDESYQLQYACPRCVEKYGDGEIRKTNLEVNLLKNVYRCWKCSDEGDDMHGSILKLIKLYGNSTLFNEYKEAVHSLRESKLYKLNFSDDEFNIMTKSVEREELNLPKCYHPIKQDKYVPKAVMDYLSNRGIGWDIINKFNMGYTEYCNDSFMPSYRVYIPSYNEYGELNYWTGRDYKNRDNVVKYYNPDVKRKDIIFNEEKVQWDADVVLVEGPFDHIVVPNSIPLLGKSLNRDYKLFWSLQQCNGNILIWLDNDAYESAKAIYKELNHGKLYNRIRIIKAPEGVKLDPSKIYELYGKKGIIAYLRSATKINEIELQT